MKLAVPRETMEGETRAAVTPESVKKLSTLGLDVVIERGVGDAAHIGDDLFEKAGASVAPCCTSTMDGADVVFKVRAPSESQLSAMPPGATLIGMLDPHRNAEHLLAYATARVNAFSMELLPRITRAQSMDVLSSQSNLAGYKAVIDAASTFHRAMPMMMTAAGTVAPARVLVMGAGVAGLQAIATARRLGAIVSATDVRLAAKEQVESLGATFLNVDSDELANAETAGGYAKEMSEDFQKRQAALIAETVRTQDIVILTALIPGRPAPTLLSEAMVESMKPGSVVVDLAVEYGGNCPLSRPGETVDVNGVTILGYRNMPGRVAYDATALYSRNLLNFLTPLIAAERNELAIDWDDEIIVATALTRDGAVVHPSFSAAATPKTPETLAGGQSS